MHRELFDRTGSSALRLGARAAPALVLGVALAAVPGWDGGAAAAEVPCDVLLQRVLDEGSVPSIQIDPKAETVRIETADAFCSEPVAVWAARETPAPPPSSVPPAPAETHPFFRRDTEPAPPPAAPAEEKPAEAAGAPPASADGCSAMIEDLWQPGHHQVIGVRYWLSQAFTIDLDGDGATDNVGFRFVAPGAHDLVIRYFAAPGLLAARSVPSLRLDDERDIYRLCFGERDFGPEPQPKAEPKPVPSVKAFEPPDLAKEMQALKEGEAGASGAAAKPRGFVATVRHHWKVIVAIAAFLLLAGGAIAYVTWQRWTRRGRAVVNGEGEADEDAAEPGDGGDDGEDGQDEEK